MYLLTKIKHFESHKLNIKICALTNAHIKLLKIYKGFFLNLMTVF